MAYRYASMAVTISNELEIGRATEGLLPHELLVTVPGSKSNEPTSSIRDAQEIELKRAYIGTYVLSSR
jgi:hypothetical protein